ncbi:hypothetical protein ACVW0P_004509 [Mucilaginibacter sp. UYNi724]
MTKQEILTSIELILPKLQYYAVHKEASFDSQELAVLKGVVKAIMPERIISFTCSPCVGEFITIVYSYYQRESQIGK